MDFISIIGTLISILGAILSWKQYKKSKTASIAAEEAANQIVQRKESLELSDLLKELDNFEKYCITCIAHKQGINQRKFSMNFQTLLSKLNKSKSRINENNEYYCRINDSYNMLNKKSDISIGDNVETIKLLSDLRELIAVITNIINKNIYKPINS